MTKEETEIIQCPSCSSPIRYEDSSGEVHCDVCGADFQMAGHLCPNCHTYHRFEGSLCLSCGTPLTKSCRECRAVNWSGSQVCANCGESIDIISLVSDSRYAVAINRLTRQMDQATAIKLAEEVASGKRMAELVAIEEARQKEIAQRLAKQKEHERKLLIIVFGAVTLFFIALLAYAIVTALN